MADLATVVVAEDSDQDTVTYYYCDSVVRTSTSCTGSVRTEYVLTLSVLPVPSVLLVYLSLIPPVHISSISTSFNVVLPRVIQHLIFTTHIYIS